MGKSTALESLVRFCDAVETLYTRDYLRRPTPRDLQRLLQKAEARGFPGMIVAGSQNNLNVLGQSPVFNDVLRGEAPNITYEINNTVYQNGYYLADSIYPRNNMLFQGRSLESVSVFNKALAYQMEFYSVNLAPICSHNREGPSQSYVNWHAPLDGQYKINVDGVAKLVGLVQGVGVVICNGNKEFMATGSRQVGVVDRINSNEEYFEAEGNLVEDIKEMQGWFRSFSCNWQRRDGNKVAHELAQYGTRNAGFFHMD
ncbi:unnamed protein product [Prunus brigantina]